MFKNLLMRVRWGKELVREDYAVAEGLSFWQLLTSSYLTPKSIVVKYDRNIKRR